MSLLYDDDATKRLDLLICIGAVLVAILVDPRGNFPLSDDWSYAHTSRVLCESGRIEFLPWTGASVLFQAGYGALLCKIAGFSFTILRLSTIAAATVGALALNHLLARLQVGGNATRLAVAVFALNPLYLNQSFTFMTDVPFTALSLVAAVLYVAGLSTPRLGKIALASVVAAAAILVRQHGVFLVVGAAVAALLARDRSPRQRVAQFTAASTIPLVTFIAFHAWLFSSQGAPAGLQNKLSETSPEATVAIIDHGFRAAVTLGFAILPVAILRLRDLLVGRRLPLATFLALFGLAAAIVYANDGSTMFYLPNVQYDLGLGALTLRDSLFLAMPPTHHLGAGLALPLTVVSIVAASAAAAWFWDCVPMLRDPGKAFILLTTLALFMGSLLHGAFYFDRYLIPVIPFAIAALLLGADRDRVPISVVVVTLAIAWYAIAGTHDYLAMNRARYAILTDIEATGVSVNRIDGGFEYNAWHSAAALGDWPTKESARRGQSANVRSWWWVQDDEYIVSSSQLDGYHVEEARPYPTWLTPGRGEVLLLERNLQP